MRRWCGPRWCAPAAIGPSVCPAPAASSAITATTRPTTIIRHVSWKATARRNKPITAVFESEHSQDVIFCLDVGRMMAARVGALTKLDHAINAVLMLTHVSQTFQDNLGLLVFSHTVHLYLPPAKGRAQHARFLQALYTVKPEYCYVNYREAFSHADRPSIPSGP